MEYNTQRDHLLLKEYGRNIKRMVQYLMTVEDREKRNSYAKTLVTLMKNINPNVKEGPEYEQKVWDDLFIISNFELEIDSPYPQPDSNILERKPDRLGYGSNHIKYKHYGKSIERLIENAVALEDPSEKQGAVLTIGKLMKSFYLTWNKDYIEDEQVLKDMDRMSGGQLSGDIEKIKEFKLFDMAKSPDSGGGRNRGRGGHHHKGKKGRSRRRN
jgi:hypothetical protein